MQPPPRFDTSVARRIGAGSSADVYRVRHVNGKDYAIKVFETADLDAANCRGLLNETRLLAALQHPHIVAYKQTFLTGDQQFVCVAMELLTGGTLGDLIRRHAVARQHMPEPLVWRCFLQLATAVAHMHAVGVVHRDLKPSNCMFSDTTHTHLKVVDLGLARRQVPGDHMLSQAGTPAYAAPEVYNRQPMSFPVDVWSLGCILHEMCALAPAFSGHSVRQLRGQVLLGLITPLPAHCSSELRGLLAEMMHKDPAQRITLPELLAHPAVASRLAQLQAQGLVSVAAAQASGLGPEQVAQGLLPASPRATWGSFAMADPDTLEQLLELLPAPRHPSDAEEVSSSPHATDAQLSGWYASDPAAAQPKAAAPAPVLPPGHELAGHQAAALRAVQLLADSPKKQPAGSSNQPTVIIHVDASSGASSGISSASHPSGSDKVPAPAAQPAPLPAAAPAAGSALTRQRSRSLPDSTEADPQQPPAVLAHLHPKFRKMAEEALRLEALGICSPRPTITQRTSPSDSPAKAPGSPLPASGRPYSTGAGRGSEAGAAATPRSPPRRPQRCLVNARAMEARIEEVKRCGGGAAAIAAAVRACLADEDEAMLRHITACVNSARSPRVMPRARAAPFASSELTAAGPLSDELGMERILPSCPSPPGTMSPSRLGHPLPPQQPERQPETPAAAAAAVVDSKAASSPAEPQQQQQRSIEPQLEARKSKRRWSFKWLLLRRRTAH